MADNPDQKETGDAEGISLGEEEKLEKTRMDISGPGTSPHDPTLRDMDVKTAEEITIGEGRSFRSLATGVASRWFHFPFAKSLLGSSFGRLLQLFLMGLLAAAGVGTLLLLLMAPTTADPLMNRLWIVLLAGDLLLLPILLPRSWVLRIPTLLLLIFGIAGLVVSEMNDVPLRAGWLGSGVFSKIPFFYLQPIYAVFEFLLPVTFFLLLIGFLFEMGKRSRVVVFVLSLTAIGSQTATAFLLFHRADVPSLASFISGNKPPIGSAGMEAADRTILLKTVGFPKTGPGDDIERLFVSLQNFRTGDNKKDIDRGPGAVFEMSVSDGGENPVLFLSRDDLELEIDGKPIRDWKLDRVGLSSRPKEGEKLRLAMKYRIEVSSLPPPSEGPTKQDEGKKSFPKELKLLAPLEGDSFWDTLSVAASVMERGEPKADPHRVKFLLDGNEIGRSEATPYQLTADTTALPSGPHRLRVEAAPVSGSSTAPLVVEVTVQKREAAPIDFARPPFGKFLASRETIEVVPNVGGVYRSVELFVGEKLLHRIEVPPFIHQWDTSDLSAGQHVLVARARGEDGSTVSDWVLVSTGEAGLRVQNDLHDKTTATADRIVLVIDASVSLQDVWDSQSKWDWQKKAILDPKVLGRLALSKAGLIGVGIRSSPAAGNCRDAAWLVKPADRPAQSIKEALGEAEPRGVSSPMAGVALALESKIDRILFVTDGWRPCPELKAGDLAKKLKRQAISIDGIALGTIEPKERRGMEEFLASSGGTFTMVDDGEELVSRLEEILTPSFQILDEKKTVLKGPLDGELHRLKPGEYDLSFPQGMGLSAERIILQNGFVKVMTIRPGETGKPFLDSSIEKL